MSNAVVFGGYGTFGSLVAQELAKRQIEVTVAGRSQEKAEAFARQLGKPHRGISADVFDADSCRRAIQGQSVAIHCAGPFADQPQTLLDACLREGCHYADIADDCGYVRRVQSACDEFKKSGLTAVYGCSALPGISGALAMLVRKQKPEEPQAARCTLFIGNRNPKGFGAVQSLVAGLGKPIAAPQGTLHGFQQRERVFLPGPYSHRSVFNFDSPEYDLFPLQLGVQEVRVKVGFELRMVTFCMAALAKLSSRWTSRSTRAMLTLATPLQFLGNSGGVVMTELFWSNGSTYSAALHTITQGQRMAALPCALAVEALCRRSDLARGAMTAYELLEAEPLLQSIQSAGFELTTR